MRTELGYEVSGPDEAGQLEVDEAPGAPHDALTGYTNYTRADLVAMLGLFDEDEPQEGEE